MTTSASINEEQVINNALTQSSYNGYSSMKGKYHLSLTQEEVNDQSEWDKRKV